MLSRRCGWRGSREWTEKRRAFERDRKTQRLMSAQEMRPETRDKVSVVVEKSSSGAVEDVVVMVVCRRGARRRREGD